MAQVAAEFGVLFRVAPGVEFESGEADVDAFLYVAFVFAHGVPGDGRGVDGDAGVVAAEHLVERHVGFFGLEVPDREVDEAEGVELHFLQAVEFPDAVPEVFAVQRVEADEFLEAAFDQAADGLAAAGFDRADDAFVGVDAQDGGFGDFARGGAVARPGQAGPPTKRITDPGVLDQITPDISNTHR